MSHDPFLPLMPYAGPRPLRKEPKRTTKVFSGEFSIDRLVSNRHRVLQTKFEVFSTLVQKRLTVRQGNLTSLLQDELTIRNRAPLSLTAGQSLAEDLEYQLLLVQKERRNEESECWRDLIPVIRDLLTTWEALEQSKIRAQFLKSYPDQSLTKNRLGGDPDA